MCYTNAICGRMSPGGAGFSSVHISSVFFLLRSPPDACAQALARENTPDGTEESSGRSS